MKCKTIALLALITLCNSVALFWLWQRHGAPDELPGPLALPKLVGSWVGPNETLSDLKGYRFWGEKTIHITEQQDRRFRGHFIYGPDNTRLDFFGVIYPDNVSFTWVSSDSLGYNHGRILGPDRISACYVESSEQATVGCADLQRQPAE